MSVEQVRSFANDNISVADFATDLETVAALLRENKRQQGREAFFRCFKNRAFVMEGLGLCKQILTSIECSDTLACQSLLEGFLASFPQEMHQAV